MTIRLQSRLSRAILFATILSVSQPAFGSDDSSTVSATQGSSDVDKLKAQLAQQQMQLEQLKNALEAQKKLIEALAKGATVVNTSAPAKPASLGDVASLTPMVPAAPAPDLNTLPAVPSSSNVQVGGDDAPSPLSLKIGNSYITPIGFMDFTSVNRTTVGGGGIGSNFGSIPYNNALNGGLSEFRLSPQNSRIGARFDSLYHGAHVLGYWESDFLGNNGGNVAVSSNSNTFRLRLYWVDVTKGQWEVMAGQSWSLMTPGRSGISPLPGNIFYSQDTDVNYQAGLTWSRQPGIRLTYHASPKVTVAFAAENAEQYVGGSGGGGTVVSPSALSGTVFTEFNSGSQTFGTPAFSPDFIAKIAFDPTSKFHFEVTGLETNFKTFNQAAHIHYLKSGGGIEANFNAEVTKGLRAIVNTYWSDGGGRYIFGEAPDLVLKTNGDIGLLHSGSTVAGIEDTIGKTLLYAYYGGVFVGRYTVIDTNGSRVGYGYTGSANSQNKAIQEATLGFNQTIWKDAKFGAINIMGQYSYLTRDPWYVAIGAPKQAHQNQIYFNLRYTLPGSAPAIK
jgi:hypothetical protein